MLLCGTPTGGTAPSEGAPPTAHAAHRFCSSPCCAWAAATAHTCAIDYYNTLSNRSSYWREGLPPAFISAAQSIKPPKPADYSV